MPDTNEVRCDERGRVQQPYVVVGAWPPRMKVCADCPAEYTAYSATSYRCPACQAKAKVRQEARALERVKAKRRAATVERRKAR